MSDRPASSKHNADPKPFVWTKPAETILAKTRRARAKVDAIKKVTKRSSRNTSAEHRWV